MEGLVALHIENNYFFYYPCIAGFHRRQQNYLVAVHRCYSLATDMKGLETDKQAVWQLQIKPQSNYRYGDGYMGVHNVQLTIASLATDSLATDKQRVGPLPPCLPPLVWQQD